jgi:hypothetical protein
VHPFVARLLVVSLGTCDLVACTDAVPARAPVGPTTFDVLGETLPEVVAAAYAASDLKSGSFQVAAEKCRAVCGIDVNGCEAVVMVGGDENRPSSMTGHIECHFANRSASSGGGFEFDPFHLNSCPFGCGRRPSSAEVPRARSADPLVGHVMDIAMLEALSVRAFAQLARDLRTHAPRLLPRARLARRDERRHARHARAVLRELGGTLGRVPSVTLVARGLEDAALDNAIEGCVSETFGAIVASVQARRAKHPSMRRFFEAIARDEVEHAALSWDVHDALWPRLGRAARAKIADGRLHALAQIEKMQALAERVRVSVGAPTVDERRALVDAMRVSLRATGTA